MADIARQGDLEFTLVDATNQYPAKVDAGGNIFTSGASGNYAGAGKLFWASVAVNITPGGTEVNILHIHNPTGSGKTDTLCCADIGFTNTVVVMASFRWYINPTITANGTAYTPVNGLINSGIASGINVYTSPTHSARGTLFLAQNINGGSASNNYQFLFDGRIIMPANSRILLTGTPDGTNRATLVNVRWIET